MIKSEQYVQGVSFLSASLHRQQAGRVVEWVCEMPLGRPWPWPRQQSWTLEKSFLSVTVKRGSMFSLNLLPPISPSVSFFQLLCPSVNSQGSVSLSVHDQLHFLFLKKQHIVWCVDCKTAGGCLYIFSFPNVPYLWYLLSDLLVPNIPGAKLSTSDFCEMSNLTKLCQVDPVAVNIWASWACSSPTRSSWQPLAYHQMHVSQRAGSPSELSERSNCCLIIPTLYAFLYIHWFIYYRIWTVVIPLLCGERGSRCLLLCFSSST